MEKEKNNEVSMLLGRRLRESYTPDVTGKLPRTIEAQLKLLREREHGSPAAAQGMEKPEDASTNDGGGTPRAG